MVSLKYTVAHESTRYSDLWDNHPVDYCGLHQEVCRARTSIWRQGKDKELRSYPQQILRAFAPIAERHISAIFERQSEAPETRTCFKSVVPPDTYTVHDRLTTPYYASDAQRLELARDARHLHV